MHSKLNFHRYDHLTQAHSMKDKEKSKPEMLCWDSDTTEGGRYPEVLLASQTERWICWTRLEFNLYVIIRLEYVGIEGKSGLCES